MPPWDCTLDAAARWLSLLWSVVVLCLPSVMPKPPPLNRPDFLVSVCVVAAALSVPARMEMS
ncbi:hypothetical protein, partial [Paracidovorax valerianellae]|uniref:hypothetical protein n=1 Tax=Paracidovorax valerianellae TaxID=187868 RepID=UPI0011139143